MQRIAIAQITGEGLAAIAVCVALLWGCLISERVIVRNAALEASRTLQEMRIMRMRRRIEPVSTPAHRLVPPPVRPSIG